MEGKRPRGGWVTLGDARTTDLRDPAGGRSVSITTSGLGILANAQNTKNTKNRPTSRGPCGPPMGSLWISPSLGHPRVPDEFHKLETAAI